MAKGITCFIRGEKTTVSRRSEMRMSEAVAKMTSYGFGEWLPTSANARDRDMMVVVLQDWYDNGTEKAVLIQSRGTHAGQYLGCMKRMPLASAA